MTPPYPTIRYLKNSSVQWLTGVQYCIDNGLPVREYTSFCRYQGRKIESLFRRRWLELELFFKP